MIKRRHHSPEFKQQVVAESNRRGASVAGVALAHGINANQLHKWRRALLRAKAAATRNTLLAVSVEPTPIMIVPPATEPCPDAIEIELLNARLTVRGRVDLDALQTILAVLHRR
jgi:transposase